jgi:hypothetical protein
MFENSLRSKDKELRKVAIHGVFLAPCLIASALLAFAAFPFHYLPHWFFCTGTIGVVLFSNLIITETLLAEANRKVREIETKLLRAETRLQNSN